jgi:uncharacterized protein YyaL (SSP411 family)
MTNHLQHSHSPYLKQHSHNPIDWFSWCDDAFEKAKNEDKPIFLSIGYSTCHWCHVMAKESFNDGDIAKKLNDDFISIKCDREERPDIDHIYMNVCQLMTGSGGWPLTIIMTPEKRPFFAGTYFPKYSHPQRVGLMDILDNVSQLWHDDRYPLLSAANKTVLHLVTQSSKNTPASIPENAIQDAFNKLLPLYDPTYGGFGAAPKFASGHTFLFLLLYGQTYNDKNSMDMALNTLEKIRLSGLFDHIGFGFHRYATDPQWVLPHFEKMAYDQAFLMWAYALAFDVTKESFYADVVKEIDIYLKRDLLDSKSGLFYTAEDADSEGIEGKFYTWTLKELEESLDTSEVSWLSSVSNLHEEGNFLEEGTRHPSHTNILTLRSRDELQEFHNIRKKLLPLRSKRIRPHLDKKCLADWNAWIISGYVNAYHHTQNSSYLDTAITCFEHLETTFFKDEKWFHVYCDNTLYVPAMSSDIVSLCMASLLLFEATCEEKYCDKAVQFFDLAVSLFWDDTISGFVLSNQDHDLIVKQKDGPDGATPSVNSMAYFCTVLLYAFTKKDTYHYYQEALFNSIGSMLSEYPLGFTFWMFSNVYKDSLGKFSCKPRQKKSPM